jgi:hypothetical protein
MHCSTNEAKQGIKIGSSALFSAKHCFSASGDTHREKSPIPSLFPHRRDSVKLPHQPKSYSHQGGFFEAADHFISLHFEERHWKNYQ